MILEISRGYPATWQTTGGCFSRNEVGTCRLRRCRSRPAQNRQFKLLDAATRSAKQGAVKVAGPNTSRPDVTLRYRLSSARRVSNGRMPTTRTAYPEMASETGTVAAQVVFARPISLRY